MSGWWASHHGATGAKHIPPPRPAKTNTVHNFNIETLEFHPTSWLLIVPTAKTASRSQLSIWAAWLARVGPIFEIRKIMLITGTYRLNKNRMHCHLEQQHLSTLVAVFFPDPSIWDLQCFIGECGNFIIYKRLKGTVFVTRTTFLIIPEPYRYRYRFCVDKI